LPDFESAKGEQNAAEKKNPTKANSAIPEKASRKCLNFPNSILNPISRQVHKTKLNEEIEAELSRVSGVSGELLRQI
jgi:hypothetical protein